MLKALFMAFNCLSSPSYRVFPRCRSSMLGAICWTPHSTNQHAQVLHCLLSGTNFSLSYFHVAEIKHDQDNLRRRGFILTHSSRGWESITVWQVGMVASGGYEKGAVISHLQLQAQSRENKLEVEEDWKLQAHLHVWASSSKTALLNLAKQCYHLQSRWSDKGA